MPVAPGRVGLPDLDERVRDGASVTVAQPPRDGDALAERLVSRFSLEGTQPSWALAYEFDIVLRGRDETPMEAAA